MIGAYTHTLQEWGHHSNRSERLNVQDEREVDQVVVFIARICIRHRRPEFRASRMHGFSTIVCLKKYIRLLKSQVTYRKCLQSTGYTKYGPPAQHAG